MIEPITTLASTTGGRVWCVDWYEIRLNKGIQSRIYWHQWVRIKQFLYGNKITTISGTKQYRFNITY